MSSYVFRDGAGSLKYAAVVVGSGTDVDPYRLNDSGGSTISIYTHSIATITDAVAGVMVLVANPARKGVIITNRSAVSCDLFFGATGVYGTGILLTGNGGTYQIDRNNLYLGAIRGITATGTTTNCSIAEGV